MSESSERFPLFPLGLVLLPGEVVPLHIFEERYKTMIGECLDQGTEFGIVWSGDEGVRDVGCAAEVAQLIERTEDGRMNILAKGTRRFTLERRIEDMPYPAGDVTWTEDTDPEEGDAGVPARKAYADLVERVTDTRPEESDLTELDAYGMASTIAFDPGEKQGLLELLTEDGRLELLTRLCTTALENLTRSQEAAQRASTNGKVHHSEHRDRARLVTPGRTGRPGLDRGHRRRGHQLRADADRAHDDPRRPGDALGGDVHDGQHLGRSWLLLGGLLPFDYDDITIERVEPGRWFQEDSTMLSQRSWRHHRAVEPDRRWPPARSPTRSRSSPACPSFRCGCSSSSSARPSPTATAACGAATGRA